MFRIQVVNLMKTISKICILNKVETKNHPDTAQHPLPLPVLLLQHQPPQEEVGVELPRFGWLNLQVAVQVGRLQGPAVVGQLTLQSFCQNSEPRLLRLQKIC